LGDNLFLNSSVKDIGNKEIYSLISNSVSWFIFIWNTNYSRIISNKMLLIKSLSKKVS
jgi:hypothetical protein